MPATGSPRSFETLRSWNGTQARAFEELSFQLLKSEAPANSLVIRTGNPDGGVEWYAVLPDGSEWGWQAKYVHGIDALLTAMTASVTRVALERPRLTRLVFVVSSNLATGTRGGERKSARQKYEAKVETWKRSIPAAAHVEFALVQASELLDRLAQPEHRGRQWFWWADPQLGRSWCAAKLHEQADAAGERYRPDLQVDLPIEEDLKALACSESTMEDLERLLGRVVAAAQGLRLAPCGPKKLQTLHRALIESAAVLAGAVKQVVVTAESAPFCLNSVAAALESFRRDVERATALELQLDREWRDRSPDARDTDERKPPTEARGYSVRHLRNTTEALDAWLGSPAGQSLQKRFYFLVGPAGSGKTHLFLDAARRALEEDRPAVVLSGARFGRGDLWASVCDQLGLEMLGADQLLGAMDAAGEAAAATGRRFVIMVDALNESAAPDFWTAELPALRSAVSRFPHVALAVSCRDTYVAVVDDGHERALYVTRTHPGFAGREVEATQKYFEHFGLEAPRIPLLTPEFSLPLFLRLYCDSLRDSGQRAAPGHEGRVRTFERYRDAKVERIAKRIRPEAATSYEVSRAEDRVLAVLNALLDEFVHTGRDGVTMGKAEVLATKAAHGHEAEAILILAWLQSEGVLASELLYVEGDRPTQGLRVVFQALADFLILRHRLSDVADPMKDPALRRWLRSECSWGIVEAACTVMPELYGIELPDFLRITAGSLRSGSGDTKSQRRRLGRARHVFRSLVETLPYRASNAVTERTLELLNQSLSLVSPDELFRILFLMAPQPDNRLNSEALHRYLSRLRMPRRDAFFGFATYHEIGNDTSPAALLARWASRGPYPYYDRRVVELASIPLVWLLSSSNRYMRDWVTKALVQLLRGHLDVARQLLDRFWDVDDPYVVQRVVVIAYGALMRSDDSQLSEACALVERVRDLVFIRPMRPDELMLDAARGILEWGACKAILSRDALSVVERPYGLTPPGNPPTRAKLEERYGLRHHLPDGESYNTIFSSVLGLGDFGAHVVDSGVRNFSRRKRGQAVRTRGTKEPRFITSRWRTFVQSLTAEQLAQLQEGAGSASAVESAASDPVDLLLAGFRSSLNMDQWALFHRCWSRPHNRTAWDPYPGERARRWVFRRTLSLGWTPEVFGQEDRGLAYGRLDRDEHKAERWGRKYQWMAYHELLARIADSYESCADDEAYEGLHQIIGDREIDPSLPPVEYRPFAEHGEQAGATWLRPPIRIAKWPPAQIDFGRYQGSLDKFLDDHDSEPSLDKVIRSTDDEGEEWVLLEAYLSQGDPDAHQTWLGLQQPMALHGWLVPQEQGPRLLPHLAEMRRERFHDVVDDHGHVDCCYVGEIGWAPHRCYNRHAEFAEVAFADDVWRLVPAVETYCWEGSLLDCSIEASVSAALPSTFIQARSTLRTDARGPCWLDSGGVPVFTNLSSRPDGRDKAFLVRANWLKTFLEDHQLELMIASWFERRLLDPDHTSPHPFADVVSAARVDSELTIYLSEPVRSSGER